MRLLSLLLPALIAATLPAESGDGDYRPTHYSILYRVKVTPLSAIGENVLRFSTTPALGGRAYIFEAHAVDRDRAAGTVSFFYGHAGSGWKRTGSMAIEMRRSDFDAAVARVDAALARATPPQKDEIMVCTDGPGYLTERRHAGKSQWLAGFCDDDHPNKAIAREVERIVGEQLGRFFTR
jgi:hypothetical protein